MSNTDHGIEAAAIVAGNKTAVVGGGVAAGSGAVHGTDIGAQVAMASGMDITGFCAMVGAFVALAGFFVSIYFQWRRDRREAKFNRWRMRDNPGVKGNVCDE